MVIAALGCLRGEAPLPDVQEPCMSRLFFRLSCVSLSSFQRRPKPLCRLPRPSPTQIPGQNAILMGTAWYPEQWPESRWEEDLGMMEAADLKVVRIAEFARCRMEPSEGHYDFDWLERAINVAAKHHIVSVLGTATATPPAHAEISRHAAGRIRRSTRDSRESRACVGQLSALSGILPPHCRADGDALRAQSQRRGRVRWNQLECSGHRLWPLMAATRRDSTH